jgi:predicted alpha/beta-hydrolase family hydrolase
MFAPMMALRWRATHVRVPPALNIPVWVMKAVSPQQLEIAVGPAGTVSALLDRPADARACFVLAHGAGAGMTHPFMVAVASGLAMRGIATLRYQFPYMEKGSRRPDPPGIAQAAVRAAVAEAMRCCPGIRLVAGGKSFGGRMTSQAQAAAPLDGVDGLAFLGFPLHPAGKPSSDRAKHLTEVHMPMLFLQGTRDNLAEMTLLEPVVKSLGRTASLHRVEGADHSFHVPARSGRNDAEVMNEVLDTLAAWIGAL